MAMTDDDPSVLDCGRTIEQLSDYVQAGRLPRDPHIESCPECLNAIEALERVGQLSRDLLEDEAARLPRPPESWFEGILSVIHSELRAGRSFPIHHPDPRVTITVTEGAVRSLVRSSADALDGIYLGRTDIVGDAETPGAPVRIELTASVAWGRSIPELTAALRTVVYRVLAEHTELNVTAVNVAVEELHGLDLEE
ncbi:Asp23/Gls24 family envelope stress response protein [Microbacterium sp. EYE_5]|nr:Asp23/Gls24 family envelope stress response protein [Microbacterium sp. EYE_382]MCK6086871.1 Asp23/Gls24 family envelope stress response protein [Microbacterium sp. EYE_384]MCK6123631.1 Asp23/Gls24 family envelope stress response protein [Microbacterium sp. EYE_80]MCK6126540.1 Asp23/Gls24 family envelope stress response protein [Microbacterium sp. EYE_79]MCK6142555.1 Asp23/Gls24 family envelope stress response protein [Microbacterium sp. EYE_39]MCK6218187.1 Asp23/Gls24 family envelope stres